MKKLLFMIFAAGLDFAIVFTLGINLVHILRNHEFSFSLDYHLIWFDGNNQYFYLLLFIAFCFWLDVLYNLYFNPKARERRKEERRLTRIEKERISHLCGRYEAKKGLQRLEYNPMGYLRDNTIRNYADRFFNPVKSNYNKLISSLHINDAHKLNELKSWQIGDETTYRRGGIPLLTYRGRVYVDAADSHSLVIGTTNSGKTYSVIHPLIDVLRMTGESMIINDLKGELIQTHYAQLIQDGYKVITINFIDPNRSNHWNPLGLVIKKYREAQKKYADEMATAQSDIEKLKELKEKSENMKRNPASNEKIAELLQLSKEIRDLENRIPQLNVSEAAELLKDIASLICYDAKANDPFWNSSAAMVLEGLVFFLLEETEMDPYTGEIRSLPDEMINFRSVKLLMDTGNIKTKTGTLLSDYIRDYRSPEDQSSIKLKSFLTTAESTKGSISSVFADKIDLEILSDDIVKMTAFTDFNLEDLTKEKTAIFLQVHDEKTTYHPLVTIFVKQFYESIIKLARNEKNLRLPIPMNIIYDEFGISPTLKDIVSMLGAMRSRGCRMTMVVQDLCQIDEKYGKEVAGSIKNNVMNIIYLLGSDPATLKDISERTGKRMVWNKEKGQYEKEPVITIDQLQKMSLGEAVILRQRRNPIKTRLNGYHRYSFYKNKPTGYCPEINDPYVPKYFDLYEASKQRIIEKIKADRSAQKGSIQKEKKVYVSLEKAQKPLK